MELAYWEVRCFPVKTQRNNALNEKQDTGVPLSFKDVAEIIKLIDASACEEVVLELEGMRLVVRRGAGGTANPAVTDQPRDTPVAAAASSTPSSFPAPGTPPARESVAPSEAGLTEIRSPMVGTFYRRPSPDTAPFVEEGGQVRKGEPLCLIEVMKLFTTIEAPADGTIVSIAVEDGAPVEFDQLLFRLRS